MANHPERIIRTQNGWNRDETDYPSDLGTGRDIYDISVHTTPSRDKAYGYGWDVTITDKAAQGWSIARRYYGIDISDAITDILGHADQFRMDLADRV